ncbi:MAG: hypothetical protein GY941_22070 [Planctomycetes bacterium]|nr:hypothetical protein [Planctomycetota bacterium]
MYTVYFQKEECGGRPKGFLTSWRQGEHYEPSHYCLVVSDELFSELRYDSIVQGKDEETGEDIVVRTPKECTYMLADPLTIEEGELVYVDDKSLVKEVRGG